MSTKKILTYATSALFFLGFSSTIAYANEDSGSDASFIEALNKYDTTNEIDFSPWLRDYCGIENDGLVLPISPTLSFAIDDKQVERWAPLGNNDLKLSATYLQPETGTSKTFIFTRDLLELTDVPCEKGMLASSAEDPAIQELTKNTNNSVPTREDSEATEESATASGNDDQTATTESSSGGLKWLLRRSVLYPLVAILGLAAGIVGAKKFKQ
ncbi:hypothetical protein BSR29_03110 [Boudabousia liubingyangii]|uniref:Uncharacterized protein n=1 Tax=Boudabousia liubingyangii TaxID=1921764 RepID=A0A1Q5PMS5_9ACTO|nr:hypothetical protein [Boudabousia liubingyangii]OKL48858.1 hypothetical protein BSR29_03110 [Boudabousia liubingyangii]